MATKKEGECFVQLGYGDPNLNGAQFSCQGSAYDGQGSPAYKGTDSVVGVTISYRTYDKKNELIDDKISTGLIGCKYFTEGFCIKGGSSCPVAPVISLEQLRYRQNFLQKLPCIK